MSGTVNNPATFGTVRSTFGPGYTNGLTPPSNMGAYIRGTQYVPLGPSYDNISETASGLRLSQFNGKKYPPPPFGTGLAASNVISVDTFPYYYKYSSGTYYGYQRGAFGAITSEDVVFGIGYAKFSTYDIIYKLRWMFFDTGTSLLNFAFDNDVRTLSGSFRIGRHSFSFSGGGSYYNGGTGNRYTYWAVSLPSNPFNAAGTLAELKHNP